MQQSKSGFKRAMNGNKYYSEILTGRRNLYLDFLIDPRFQGVKIHFLFSRLKIIPIEQDTQDIFFQKYK